VVHLSTSLVHFTRLCRPAVDTHRVSEEVTAAQGEVDVRWVHLRPKRRQALQLSLMQVPRKGRRGRCKHWVRGMRQRCHDGIPLHSKALLDCRAKFVSGISTGCGSYDLRRQSGF
jgi:hypothetical protein